MTCKMEEKVHPKTGAKRLVGMGDIWSKEEFGNFDLTLSYKLSERANSGVFYRSDKNNPVQGGFDLSEGGQDRSAIQKFRN